MNRYRRIALWLLRFNAVSACGIELQELVVEPHDLTVAAAGSPGRVEEFESRMPVWTSAVFSIVADNDARYYDVTSALDISGATFVECEIEGVPRELVAVNETDQFIVDFTATDSFLANQQNPEDGPFETLSMIHERHRRFGYNYVHVIPRTKSQALLECWHAVADILKANDLMYSV